MQNSEPPTRVSAAAPAISLLDAPVRRPVRVRTLGDGCAAIEAEGIHEGSVVEIERRIALGGPLVVTLGRARLAIPRALAALVQIEPTEA